MSRIDWAVAEVKYVTKPEASYDWIAKLFNVDKTTVVRHAVRRSWPVKRERYTEKRIEELEKRTLQTRVDADERHLRILRYSQAFFNNELVGLLRKQDAGLEVTRKEIRGIVGITNAMMKSIMTERTILGLPVKIHRITDQEVLKDLQEMMGYTKVPFWQKYTLTKQLLESTDIEKIKKHLKLLEDYKKKVDRTGDMTIKHPLWDD